MHIGINITATEKNRDIARIAQRLETLGFESIWIGEHPIIPVEFTTRVVAGDAAINKLPDYYNGFADPFISLAMAGAATTRLKLATGVCLIPERETLVTAKMIATLDMFTAGRVILGVGAGWLREEAEILGANFDTRWERLHEAVEAMRILWTQDEPAYQGRQVRFPPLYCNPKPAQKSGPPVFLGGHGPKSLERVGRLYDGWCPQSGDPNDYRQKVATIRKIAREAGRNPDALQMAAYVDPEDGALSADKLKAFRDAGADRIVLFSPTLAAEIANGNALQCIDRVAPIVERAQHI